MQTTLAVEDIQMSLPELLDTLATADEVILTRNNHPVAKLVSESAKPPRPVPGLGRGSIVYMAPDFDAPLEEFQGYME